MLEKEGGIYGQDIYAIAYNIELGVKFERKSRVLDLTFSVSWELSRM